MTATPQDPLRANAVTVVETLRGAGFEALWAGGCVRDMVLGLRPKDYDIATSALPEEVIALFTKTIPVGVQFGVVRVLLAGHAFEVATFRADGDYLDGRRPEGVKWANAREDVLRRDFTINGLLFDPVNETLVDYVDGQRDIALRVIRAIGAPEARFREDSLRILRALRFSARLDFAIEEDTWRQIQAFAPQIRNISIERVRDEIERLLTEGGASRGLQMLIDSGVGVMILPDLDLSVPTEHFGRLGVCDPATGWALLLAQGTGAAAAAMLEFFRHSNQFIRLVEEVVATAHALEGYEDLGIAARKRLLRRAGTSHALVVARTQGVDLGAAEADLARWTRADLSPPALISGRELTAAGHTPGPGYREALEAVETAQLEARLHDSGEALALAAQVLADFRA